MSTEDFQISENVCLPVGPRDLLPVGESTASGDSVVELIQEAANSIRELMSPCLTNHSLNDARFTIMRAIHGSSLGECSQSELARCLKQSEANVSTLLDRMRGDGLVSREKSPLDRRRSVVRLTDRGDELLARAEQEYAFRTQEVMRCFAVYEVQAFREQLHNFIAVCEMEFDQADADRAVAGRIGDLVPETTSVSDDAETRHAQAG
jgi:DNA-binding MarR family transcriptional regulator